MLLIVMSLFQLVLPTSHASSIPPCLDNQDRALDVMNAQVVTWKTTTANLFLARARVQGTVSDVYPDRNGHNHFAILLDSNPSHNLEVVYGQDFGALPAIHVGMKVEACGDYITSNAAAQYPASPAGAIIHWIHKNPRNRGHKSGYLVIDGTLYGQGFGHSN